VAITPQSTQHQYLERFYKMETIISATLAPKSIGYAFANALDTTRNLVKPVALEYPEANWSDEFAIDLKAGMSQRWAENQTGKPEYTNYVLEGSAYVPMDDKAKFDKYKGDKLSLTPAYVLSFSSSDMAQMGQRDDGGRGKALKVLITTPRTAHTDYVSKTYNRFKSAVLDVNKKDAIRVNKEFAEWVKETLSITMDKRAKSNLSRGNITDADYKRLRNAVIAFNTVWNHQD
jgi:hypothetical protein